MCQLSECRTVGGGIDIKKRIGQGLFFVLVIGLTIYGVFHGEDLNSIARHVTKANPGWLLACVGIVLAFIACESWIIRDLFCKLHIHLERMECFLYSCVGFFFSCVTPSASGGQPAQMVYMKKRGIRVSASTNVLMWVTIFYKMVLVVIGFVLVIFRLGFLRTYMRRTIWLFYLGIFLNVVCVAFMILMWVKSEWLEAMGAWGIKLLNRLHIGKRSKKRRRRLRRFIKNYDASFVALRGEILIIIKAFVITFVQRMLLFAITPCVYLSFGLTGYSFWDILILQAAISIAVDMLPLPGGSGISEHLFSVIFTGIFGGRLLIPAMVLSRGIAYYVQLLFCAVMTVVAHVYFTKKARKCEEIL